MDSDKVFSYCWFMRRMSRDTTFCSGVTTPHGSILSTSHAFEYSRPCKKIQARRLDRPTNEWFEVEIETQISPSDLAVLRFVQRPGFDLTYPRVSIDECLSVNEEVYFAGSFDGKKNKYKESYVAYPCTHVMPSTFTGPFDWDTYETNLSECHPYRTYGEERKGCDDDFTLRHPGLPMIVCAMKIKSGGSGGPLFRKNGDLMGIACIGDDSLHSFIHVSAIKQILRLSDEFGNDIGPIVESDSESKNDDDEDLSDRSDGEEEASDAEGASNGTTADDITPDIGSDLESGKDDGCEDLPNKADDEEEASDAADAQGTSNGWMTTADDVDIDNHNVIAYAERYYPTVEEVETLLMDELEQPLEQPIIKPVCKINFESGVKDSSTYVYTKFLLGLMSNPSFIRNVASKDMTAALRLVYGALLIVDAAEGVMVDRLNTELKLTPKDGYHKIRYTIEAINNLISASSSTVLNVQFMDPVAGNVCFASAKAGWSFTLQSSAKLFVKLHGIPFDADKSASRLWGDFYFDTNARVFEKKQRASGDERLFVQFVLEPLYKICNQVIGAHQKNVEATLAELGVTRSNAAYKLNVRPLLRLPAFSVFGSGTGFTDMLVHHIPSAGVAASRKVKHTEIKKSAIYSFMVDCNPSGPLMVNITKLYLKSDCSTFDAFGRVYCCELQTGQSVRFLGEGYSRDDKEGMTEKEVTQSWVYQARYRIPIRKAPPGSWVFMEGVDASIMKTAMLCSVRYDDDAYLFRPLPFNTLPEAKTITEPLNRSEVPKMFEGLQKIS